MFFRNPHEFDSPTIRCNTYKSLESEISMGFGSKSSMSLPVKVIIFSQFLEHINVIDEQVALRSLISHFPLMQLIFYETWNSFSASWQKQESSLLHCTVHCILTKRYALPNIPFLWPFQYLVLCKITICCFPHFLGKRACSFSEWCKLFGSSYGWKCSFRPWFKFCHTCLSHGTDLG